MTKPKEVQKIQEPNKEALMESLLQYKNSADMIQNLIEIINAGTYPISILDRVPAVVQYVHELKKGTHAQIKALQDQIA